MPAGSTTSRSFAKRDRLAGGVLEIRTVRFRGVAVTAPTPMRGWTFIQRRLMADGKCCRVRVVAAGHRNHRLVHAAARPPDGSSPLMQLLRRLDLHLDETTLGPQRVGGVGQFAVQRSRLMGAGSQALRQVTTNTCIR